MRVMKLMKLMRLTKPMGVPKINPRNECVRGPTKNRPAKNVILEITCLVKFITFFYFIHPPPTVVDVYTKITKNNCA